jgi:hypothetical protein
LNSQHVQRFQISRNVWHEKTTIIHDIVSYWDIFFEFSRRLSPRRSIRSRWIVEYPKIHVKVFEFITCPKISKFSVFGTKSNNYTRSCIFSGSFFEFSRKLSSRRSLSSRRTVECPKIRVKVFEFITCPKISNFSKCLAQKQ